MLSSYGRISTNAPTNKNPHTRTVRFGVRELRQAYGHTNAREAQEKRDSEAEETEPIQGLVTFSCRALGASAAHASVFLILTCQAIPRQATPRNLPTHESKSLRVRELAPVIAERLLIQVPEQVKRLHGNVGAVQLPLNETPKILHRVRVNVARAYSTAWLMTACW